MRYTLQGESLRIALSWLQTRIDDPSGEEDADAALWLQSLEAGSGTAELPRVAWALIADDLWAETDGDPPLCDGADNAATARKHARWRRDVRKVCRDIMSKLETCPT